MNKNTSADWNILPLTSPQYMIPNSSQPFASIILRPIAGTLLNWDGTFNVIDGGIGVFIVAKIAHWLP